MARAVVRAGLVALGLAWALFAQAVPASGLKNYVIEGSRAAGLDACVEPATVMRRAHMEFIQHQRDATVYGGIRATRHSLAGCVDCHTSYMAPEAPTPIHAPGQFCAACHAYAAVTMNCFDCHAAVPSGPIAAGTGGAAADAAHQAAGLFGQDFGQHAAQRGDGH